MNYSEEPSSAAEGSRRRRFSKATKLAIERYTRSVCCYCRRTTYSAADSSPNHVNYGEAAHIKAVSPAWPRYDQNLAASECCSFSNGIWLCRICHKEIDDRNNISLYTVEYLELLKEQTREMTDIQNNQPFLAIPPSFREEEEIAEKFRARLRKTLKILEKRERGSRYITEELRREISDGAYGFPTNYIGKWNSENPLRSVSTAHYPVQDALMEKIQSVWSVIRSHVWLNREIDPVLQLTPFYRPDMNTYIYASEEYFKEFSSVLEELSLSIERYLKQPNQLYVGRSSN